MTAGTRGTTETVEEEDTAADEMRTTGGDQATAGGLVHHQRDAPDLLQRVPATEDGQLEEERGGSADNHLVDLVSHWRSGDRCPVSRNS